MKSTGQIITLFLLTVPFFVCAQSTFVESKASGEGKTYGIVIGVADYANHPKLNFADKDALEFYLYLTKASHTDEKKVFIFLNQEATREKIAEKFYRIVNQARPGDRVFIYFSGHGDIEQLYTSDNFFLLLGNSCAKNYMTRPNDLLDKGFFDRYIQLLIVKRVRVIFICDACHAGSLIGGEAGRIRNSEGFMRSWKNEIKLLSCQSDQYSQEGTKWGGGRSLFSFYLILGIEGLADKDGDGRVSVSELQDYLDSKVVAAAKDFNLSQQPEIIGEKEFIVSTTWPGLVSEARRQFQSNSSSAEYAKLASAIGTKLKIENSPYTFKTTVSGQSNQYLEMELGDQIADSYLRSVYYSFKGKIASGSLLQPDDNSAFYYYKLFNDSKGDSAQSDEMRATLLTALLNTYDDLLDPLYKDDTTAFESGLRSYDDNNLTVASGLSGNDLPAVSEHIQAKLLFLNACRLPAGSGDSLAIPLLEKAIAIDSLSPAFYLKLGDRYFAKKEVARAIDNYKMYVQLLPNEEHGRNKLEGANNALNPLFKK
jgi:hypothetical protein